MKSIKSLLYISIGKLMQIIFSFYKFENKVFFTSFSGLNYSDNPKVISEYLYETRPDIVQVWAFKNPNTVNVPKYIKKVNS